MSVGVSFGGELTCACLEHRPARPRRKLEAECSRCRTYERGGMLTGRLGSSLFEARGSAQGFKAGPDLNPSSFLTKGAYLLSLCIAAQSI